MLTVQSVHAGLDDVRVWFCAYIHSQDARLMRWNHVLDVDVSVLSSMTLQHFQRFLDQISQVLALPLAVVDAVTRIH